MKKYLIDNNGCDDTTRFEIELTDEELQTILKFIKLNNKNSYYGCQPKIDIYDKYFYLDDRPVSYGWVNDEYLEGHSLLGEKENE